MCLDILIDRQSHIVENLRILKQRLGNYRIKDNKLLDNMNLLDALTQEKAKKLNNPTHIPVILFFILILLSIFFSIIKINIMKSLAEFKAQRTVSSNDWWWNYQLDLGWHYWRIWNGLALFCLGLSAVILYKIILI